MNHKIFTLPSAIFIFSLFFSCRNGESAVEIKKSDESILIQGTLPSGINEIEVYLQSNRCKKISHYREVSSFDPNYEREKMRYDTIRKRWNFFYPVVDVELKETMKGVALFDTLANLGYAINGMYFKEAFELKDTVAIVDSKYLINWENAFYVQPGSADMTSFYLQDKIATNSQHLQLEYKLLSPDWGGKVVVYGISGEEKREIAKADIQNDFKNPREGSLDSLKNLGLSKERLIGSLKASIDFTLGCQDKSLNSPTHNGLNLFYDLDAKTYRRPIWIWGWGPSMGLLVKAAEIPEIKEQYGAKLLQVANGIGQTSLKFQKMDKESPAYGLITSRWNEAGGSLHRSYGFEHHLNVADTEFMVGWGWIPLYEATGDERYLNGAKLLTETAGKLMKQFEIIPMDYKEDAGEWKDYAINEQGFGAEGIAELYRVTKNDDYRKIGMDYMQMLLKVMKRDDGLWDKLYFYKAGERKLTTSNTRSQGWVMEGLLATYRLSREKTYLDMAKKLADSVMENQEADGHWNILFNDHSESSTVSAKSTALWSCLFYMLYKETNEPAYLKTARIALSWCLDNQYNGSDYHAYGGIVSMSSASGVVYRKWFPLACTYTSGFFGLAVIEELALQGK